MESSPPLTHQTPLPDDSLKKTFQEVYRRRTRVKERYNDVGRMAIWEQSAALAITVISGLSLLVGRGRYRSFIKRVETTKQELLKELQIADMRQQKELQRIRTIGLRSCALDVLNVVDNVERACSNAHSETGITMIEKDMSATLARYNPELRQSAELSSNDDIPQHTADQESAKSSE